MEPIPSMDCPPPEGRELANCEEKEFLLPIHQSNHACKSATNSNNAVLEQARQVRE